MKKYYKVCKDNGMTPLSAIILPKGGAFSVIPASLNSTLNDSCRERKNGDFFLYRRDKNSEPKKITFKPAPTTPRLLILKPNSILIFR